MNDKIPNVYFAILDLPKMSQTPPDEFVNEFDMGVCPDSGPNRTYVTAKNDDDDYLIYVFDIPNTAKRLFKFKAKRLLRPMFKRPSYIMEKLDRSFRALMVYEQLKELVLVVPENLFHYRPIFDVVINTIFKTQSKRYDPKSGEAIIHVTPLFNFDDIKIEDVDIVERSEGSDDE